MLDPLKERSLFLLGSRQTGKTTVLQGLFPQATVYDLLQANQFQELSADPTLIRQRLKSSDSVAIEVKAKPRVTDSDLKGLRALKEETIFKRLLCVSDEISSRTTDDGLEIIPLPLFLRELWTGGIVSTD